MAARRPVRPSSLRVAEIVTPPAPSTLDEALEMERAFAQGITVQPTTANESCADALIRPERRAASDRASTGWAVGGALLAALLVGGPAVACWYRARSSGRNLRRGVSVAIDTMEAHAAAQAVVVTKVGRGGELVKYKI